MPTGQGVSAAWRKTVFFVVGRGFPFTIDTSGAGKPGAIKRKDEREILPA
jgi:hypothetical protein